MEILKQLLAGRGPRVIGVVVLVAGGALASGKVDVSQETLDALAGPALGVIGLLIASVSAAYAAKPPEAPKAPEPPAPKP